MNTAELQNPFCLGPIRLEAQFFGRKEEIRQALRFLSKEQSVSIVGSSKVGKTSFLFHVTQPFVRAKRKLVEEQVFVYFDCRSLVELYQGECYLRIREEIIRQIKDMESVDKAVGTQLERIVREAGSQTAYFGLRTLFRTAQKSDLHLIVLLDNFEYLARNHRLDEHFFSGLRGLSTNHQMAYLVASQSSLDKLERVRPEASPFFNIFTSVQLGPLTPTESRKLVCTSLKRVYVKFSELVIDHILELGNNEPYHLQRAGYVAFQVWQENREALCDEHCREISRRFKEFKI